MRSILANPTFRALFSAQVIALLGTGLLTIALALLAFEIAGSDAGIVLGIALTIKMLAYVIVAPVMSAAIAGFNRRTVMISADLIRVGVALSLPFVEAAWQIYLLIFLLQCASATFTPTFQATIPDVLPDEGAYTRALSLSRLAFDIESLISPTLAALLLLVLAPSALFGLTALGFLGSAWLIFRTPLPDAPVKMDRPFHERVTRGSRIYLATPRLRGLFALGGTVSAVGAVIIVQSVVIAKGIYGGSEPRRSQSFSALMASARWSPRWLCLPCSSGCATARSW
ncbi:MAG: MFS transporter [Pseudomonadota bacterium]